MLRRKLRPKPETIRLIDYPAAALAGRRPAGPPVRQRGEIRTPPAPPKPWNLNFSLYFHRFGARESLEQVHGPMLLLVDQFPTHFVEL